MDYLAPKYIREVNKSFLPQKRLYTLENTFKTEIMRQFITSILRNSCLPAKYILLAYIRYVIALQPGWNSLRISFFSSCFQLYFIKFSLLNCIQYIIFIKLPICRLYYRIHLLHCSYFVADITRIFLYQCVIAFHRKGIVSVKYGLFLQIRSYAYPLLAIFCLIIY